LIVLSRCAVLLPRVFLHLHPFFGRLTPQVRFARIPIELSIRAADFYALTIERDLFHRLRFFDLDLLGLRFGIGMQEPAGLCGIRIALLEQPLQRIELRVTTTAAHLPVGNTQDVRRYSECRLAVGALSQQSSATGETVINVLCPSDAPSHRA
jgi:hypothetical protein